MIRTFYVAGALKDGARVQGLGDAIVARGGGSWRWRCDWSRMPALSPLDPRAGAPVVSDDAAMAERAIEEIRTCRDVDVVAVVGPGGRGTHVEIGAALASRVPVVLWVPPGVDLDQPYPSVFHRHPLVRIVRGAFSIEEVAAAVIAAVDPMILPPDGVLASVAG